VIDLVIMRELGPWPCQPRPFRPITTIAGDLASTPALVDRDFTADEPANKLVGDIAYIPTLEGRMQGRDGEASVSDEALQQGVSNPLGTPTTQGNGGVLHQRTTHACANHSRRTESI